MPCDYCGELFVSYHAKRYCSATCKRDALKDPFKRKDPAMPQRPKLTILEMAKLAREHGTSYGKLEARMRAGGQP